MASRVTSATVIGRREELAAIGGRMFDGRRGRAGLLTAGTTTGAAATSSDLPADGARLLRPLQLRGWATASRMMRKGSRLQCAAWARGGFWHVCCRRLTIAGLADALV